jgi:hypothetical protein
MWIKIYCVPAWELTVAWIRTGRPDAALPN